MFKRTQPHGIDVNTGIPTIFNKQMVKFFIHIFDFYKNMHDNVFNDRMIKILQDARKNKELLKKLYVAQLRIVRNYTDDDNKKLRKLMKTGVFR